MEGRMCGLLQCTVNQRSAAQRTPVSIPLRLATVTGSAQLTIMANNFLTTRQWNQFAQMLNHCDPGPSLFRRTTWEHEQQRTLFSAE
jgi:hypothetical protein